MPTPAQPSLAQPKEQDRENPPAGKPEEFEYQIREVKQSEKTAANQASVRTKEKPKITKGTGISHVVFEKPCRRPVPAGTQPNEGEKYAAGIPCHAPPSQPKSKPIRRKERHHQIIIYLIHHVTS
jgi:hypothetical protein